MKPIHKFNNGRGATICTKCSVIISEGLTKELYCEKCKPKQETTLEEAGVAYAKTVKENHTSHMLGFHNGAKWQQEQDLSMVQSYLSANLENIELLKRSYSEEEVIAFGEFIFKHSLLTHTIGVESLFEQFKNK